METTKKDIIPTPNGSQQLLKLGTIEFITAITAFSKALNEDIERLSAIQKENEKEVIATFNKQLEFLESYKKEEELTTEAKEKIYNDFNMVANKLGNYRIDVYKAVQKEKYIKQVLQGAVELAKVVTLGSIAIALIKKIK